MCQLCYVVGFGMRFTRLVVTYRTKEPGYLREILQLVLPAWHRLAPSRPPLLSMVVSQEPERVLVCHCPKLYYKIPRDWGLSSGVWKTLMAPGLGVMYCCLFRTPLLFDCAVYKTALVWADYMA